jgi:hypothetical protein
VQTGRDPAAQWSVGELHLFDGSRELPHNPAWKLRARPNPWDAGWAFDANPLTRWRSLEALAPGMHLDAEFGDPIDLDAVAVDCSSDQWNMRITLDGLETAAPQRSELPPAADQRAAAVRELARRGITHVLLRDADFGAADFRDHAADWGLRLAGQVEEWRLYAVQ